MGCCGQKRAALTNAPRTVVTRPSPRLPTIGSSPPAVGSQTTVSSQPALPLPVAQPQAVAYTQPVQALSIYSLVPLRYTETSPMLVLGPATGRQYQFSGSNPVQAVDRRDVVALLHTRLFRPV